MISHSIGGIHEYFGHRGQVSNTLHPQPKKVSVYGLSMNSLKTNGSMLHFELFYSFPLLEKSGSHIVCVFLVCLDSFLQHCNLLFFL